MKTFQIYKHPITGIEAIKVGFCFPAFFFGWIWMFLKKLWALGCIYLFLQFLIITFNDMAMISMEDEEFGMFFFAFIFGTGVLATAGINGNKWWSAALLKRGFKNEATIQASNKDAALALYANKQGDSRNV